MSVCVFLCGVCVYLNCRWSESSVCRHGVLTVVAKMRWWTCSQPLTKYREEKTQTQTYTHKMVMDIRDLIARFFPFGTCETVRFISFGSMFKGVWNVSLSQCVYPIYMCACACHLDSEAKPHADKSIIDLKCYTCKMQILIGLKTNYFEPLVCCYFYNCFTPSSNY